MMLRTTRFRRPVLAASLLAASALSGVAGWGLAPALADTAPAVTAPLNVDHPAAQALPGFADLVQRVRPAVVTITTTSREAAQETSSPFQPGSPQDRKFGQLFGGGGGQDTPRTVHALGSGFIVDAAGHVVTNNHVVKDATDIHVTLSDGRELPAKVVGVDPRTDLAVLEIKSDQPFAHLALGDSDAARVGDWVVAVGNPFGLGGTVTAGILSARGREIGQGPYDDFLQIDAPINRGNSGGPLFAQDGSVIGVNTAIFSPSGGSVGIGFAIPSNLVKQVVDQLEAHGSVQRGWLGVGTQTVTPTLASALHLAHPGGAIVTQVQPDSPAAKAGLQTGDVVTALSSHPVNDPRDLARLVAGMHPGAEASLTVVRDGQDRTLTASIAELRDAGAGKAAESEHSRTLGLALAPLDDNARQALDLPAGQRGVVVASVKQGSPAEEAGLKAGDLLSAVGNHPVTTLREAVDALRSADQPGAAIALRVMRDGQNAFVALRVPSDQG